SRIILYEDGKKVEHSQIFHNMDFQHPVCEEGTCSVGQQYSSVTFYKTKESKILDYSEWTDNFYLDKKGCESYVTKKDNFNSDLVNFKQTDEYKKIIEKSGKDPFVAERENVSEIREKRIAYMNKMGHSWYYNPECEMPSLYFRNYGDVYLKNLRKNAVYSTTILLPAPEGGEPAPLGQLGGMIGTPRTLAIDLDKGRYVEIQGEISDIFPEQLFLSKKQEVENTNLKIQKNLVLLGQIRKILIILLLIDIIAIGFISIKSNKRRKKTEIIEMEL
ncbi:MAG: hypothetical protein KAI72_02690, partial [Candidatus Pacebacteria bacterium]|nr:hypothetical protein [Candidatus Paceibacterota bacterium]